MMKIVSRSTIVGSCKITGFTIQHLGEEPEEAFNQIETCAKKDLITF